MSEKSGRTQYLDYVMGINDALVAHKREVSEILEAEIKQLLIHHTYYTNLLCDEMNDITHHTKRVKSFTKRMQAIEIRIENIVSGVLETNYRPPR